MAVDDAMRLRIHRKLEQLMGTEEADYMVTNWLPWHDLATKDDLRAMSADLRTEMADLRTEMADLRTEVRTEVTGLRGELHEAIATQTRWLVSFVAVWSGLILAAARLAF